jgi:hypothetical protein
MRTTRRHLDDRSAFLDCTLGFGEQFRRGDLIGDGESDQRAERDVHGAAFDSPQMLGVNPDPLRRLLLRQTGVSPKVPDAIAELALLALDSPFERTAAPDLRTAVSVGGGGPGHFPSGLRDSSLELHNSWCAVQSGGTTDDLTDVILARVGPGAEGDREHCQDGIGNLQKPNGLNYPQRDHVVSEAGYHRCHGEDAMVIALAAEVSAETLCMDVNLASASTLPERGESCEYRCVHPRWVRRFFFPKEGSACATRGIAGHLTHHGSILRTREPRRERRASEAWQAAQSGNVSREGRSLRSSLSAGKPRAWRREAVDASDA